MNTTRIIYDILKLFLLLFCSLHPGAFASLNPNSDQIRERHPIREAGQSLIKNYLPIDKIVQYALATWDPEELPRWNAEIGREVKRKEIWRLQKYTKKITNDDIEKINKICDEALSMIKQTLGPYTYSRSRDIPIEKQLITWLGEEPQNTRELMKDLALCKFTRRRNPLRYVTDEINLTLGFTPGFEDGDYHVAKKVEIHREKSSKFYYFGTSKEHPKENPIRKVESEENASGISYKAATSVQPTRNPVRENSKEKSPFSGKPITNGFEPAPPPPGAFPPINAYGSAVLMSKQGNMRFNALRKQMASTKISSSNGFPKIQNTRGNGIIKTGPPVTTGSTRTENGSDFRKDKKNSHQERK